MLFLRIEVDGEERIRLATTGFEASKKLFKVIKKEVFQNESNI